MSCCPTDSWGKLEVEGYEPKVSNLIFKQTDLNLKNVIFSPETKF